MQIGIFETVHFEVAYTVIKLFDNGTNKITIFTDENSFRQFQHQFKESITKYSWVVRQSSESRLLFVRRIYKHCRQANFDILYLNTISDNHIVYALMILFLGNTRVILTLHDINNYFSFRPGLGFRGWIRYAGRQALLKTVSEFNVISSTMVDYLKARLPPDKKVYNVPGGVYEESKRPAVHKEVMDSLKIVIPGTIDTRRRNYNLAFDLLDEINQKELPFSVLLLGGISEYGKDILEKCRRYISKTSNLVFFQTDMVDQPIFDRELDDCHFIWLPCVVDTVIADGIAEKYGLSKSSGTLFDVIKHAKPFIIPREFTVPAELESSCFQYGSKNEIVAFLESFLLHPGQYTPWAANAINNSKLYTIENVRKNNPSLFKV